MIRDIDRNHPPEDRGEVGNAPPTKEDVFIQRIDQVRGVIALAVHATAWDHGVYSAVAASALDLANEELQRLRVDIDTSRGSRTGKGPALALRREARRRNSMSAKEVIRSVIFGSARGPWRRAVVCSLRRRRVYPELIWQPAV